VQRGSKHPRRTCPDQVSNRMEVMTDVSIRLHILALLDVCYESWGRAAKGSDFGKGSGMF